MTHKAKRNRWEENEPVTRYWLAHYSDDKTMLCTLCGNTGVIDTTETATSPAGVKSGRRNWCICPNGQAQRGISGKPVPEVE